MTSTMINVKVDRSESVPLHDQVAAEIRKAIADGEAAPGERLPLTQDIASVLGVNKNTVIRAMRILRDEGVVEFGRGRGITVSGTAPGRSAVVERARDLIQFARRHGYRRDEVIRLIEQL
jgi:GntR family transcriptional regulator